MAVDLLLAMGYGGTVEDAGSAIGKTNGGGIDGVIKEDVLGLDTMFIQAKKMGRYDFYLKKCVTLLGHFSTNDLIKVILNYK